MGVKEEVLRTLRAEAGTSISGQALADRLGVSQAELSALAREGSETKISSMCTVFAESEVISLIGRGVPRSDIARGVIDSVVARVAALAGQSSGGPFFLTGGLCENGFVIERLGVMLGSPVTTCPEARYAGALGAADRARALAR